MASFVKGSYHNYEFQTNIFITKFITERNQVRVIAPFANSSSITRPFGITISG